MWLFGYQHFHAFSILYLIFFDTQINLTWNRAVREALAIVLAGVHVHCLGLDCPVDINSEFV